MRWYRRLAMSPQDDPSKPPGRLDLGPRPRVLAIRLSAMGDVLLTFPAVLAIKQRWPEAHLAFLTDSRLVGLLEGLQGLDEQLTLDRTGLKHLEPAAIWGLVAEVLRPAIGRTWDLVLDFHGYGETGLIGRLTGARFRVGRQYKTRSSWLYSHWIQEPHPDVYMAAAHLNTLVRTGLISAAAGDAWQRSAGTPYFTISQRASDEWAGRAHELELETFSGIRTVALFVGAAKPEKLWSSAGYARLALELDRALPDLELRFLVLGGPADRTAVEAVIEELHDTSLAKRVVDGRHGSIAALAAAFAQCVATISNDTGPMHLSVAVGIPTLGIFRLPLPHFLPPPPHRHVVAPEGGDLEHVPLETVAAEAIALLRHVCSNGGRSVGRR